MNGVFPSQATKNPRIPLYKKPKKLQKTSYILPGSFKNNPIQQTEKNLAELPHITYPKHREKHTPKWAKIATSHIYYIHTTLIYARVANSPARGGTFTNSHYIPTSSRKISQFSALYTTPTIYQ